MIKVPCPPVHHRGRGGRGTVPQPARTSTTVNVVVTSSAVARACYAVSHGGDGEESGEAQESPGRAADGGEGADQQRTPRIPELAPDLRRPHGLAEPFGRCGGRERGEGQRGEQARARA